MSVVSLREIVDGNRDDVLSLSVTPIQARFVSSVVESLEEAEETPEGKPWYRAVYADDRPVGFVMLSWNVTPDPPRIIGPWFLWRLLIDVEHQGRGYGSEAVRLVADIARDNGASELLTSYGVGEGGPERFYRRVGFRPTGELAEKGEVIVALDLDGG
jgi:RimJ/RimL family protein N-acetyltransferase